jgi:hypothetical protein
MVAAPQFAKDIDAVATTSVRADKAFFTITSTSTSHVTLADGFADVKKELATTSFSSEEFRMMSGMKSETKLESSRLHRKRWR